MPHLNERGFAAFDRAIAWLEAGGDGRYKFDMSNWGAYSSYSEEGVCCESTCCIGGYISVSEQLASNDEIKRKLGMSHHDFSALFFSERPMSLVFSHT